MTTSHKTELLSQSWHDIKLVHDHLGRAVSRLEQAERSIEAVLYLEGCDLEAEPMGGPVDDEAPARKGGGHV